MNAYRSEDNSYCYFHPKEDLVGICPLCLNERLLVLATKKSSRSSARAARGNEGTAHRKPPIKLTKIFAFGSLLNRFEFRHWKSDNSDHDAASTSQEGKFCCSYCCYLLLMFSAAAVVWHREFSTVVIRVPVPDVLNSLQHRGNRNISYLFVCICKIIVCADKSMVKVYTYHPHFTDRLMRFRILLIISINYLSHYVLIILLYVLHLPLI